MNIIKQLIPFKTKRKIKDHLGVPSLHGSLQNLKRLGYSPNFVLDIGAYHGNWALDFIEVFPGAQILMFEAQASKEEILKAVNEKNPNINYHISLLSAKDGEVFSFFENETASHVTSGQTEGAVNKIGRSLDSLLIEKKFPLPDFMKLDVQGFEIAVLKGAKASLEHAQFCLMEVSCLQLGEEPVVLEVMNFMDQQGFQLYDVCQLMRRPYDKALYQMDFLFCKKTSGFVSEKRWD